MKLYHMSGACSLADLIVLQWVDVPHDVIAMSLADVGSPDYVKLNAGASVPLLIDGDFGLTENVAILGYLADLHPEAELFGNGLPRDRAEVMRWLAYLNSDVHAAFKPIFTPSRYLDDAMQAGPLAERARVRVRGYLERLNGQLEGRDWLTGHRSIADPYLFVILRWAAGKKIAFADLGNLVRFAASMDSDAGVVAALASERRAVASA